MGLRFTSKRAGVFNENIFQQLTYLLCKLQHHLNFILYICVFIAEESIHCIAKNEMKNCQDQFSKSDAQPQSHVHSHHSDSADVCPLRSTHSQSSQNPTRSAKVLLSCDECGVNGFKTRRDLLTHRRTHHEGSMPLRRRRSTGERRQGDTKRQLVGCVVCGESFRRLADLAAHRHTHDNDTMDTGDWRY